MEKVLVDAIEDGRLVRVTEEYARQEGLLVVKRPTPPIPSYDPKLGSSHMHERQGIKPFDAFRRPLRPSKNNIINELVENFHWKIMERRKNRGLSRKQFAAAIGEREENIKLVENGILPYDDYVMLSRIQQVLGLNLRKDGRKFDTSARTLVEPGKEERKVESRKQESKESAEELIDDIRGAVADDDIDEEAEEAEYGKVKGKGIDIIDED
ncbi:MAG: hypothetical protein WCK90_03870 [archaeon]